MHGNVRLRRAFLVLEGHIIPSVCEAKLTPEI